MTEPGTVVQRWSWVSGTVPREFYEDETSRAAIEKAERLNAVTRSVEQGFVPVPGAEVTVEWVRISDVGVELIAQIARDLDGRVSEEGWQDKPEAEIQAEEERRRQNVRGSAVMRVEFDVYAPAEEPGLVSIARDTHAVLAAEGAQVLADKDASVLLCGGALRRHKLPPRDAAWLRDGVISAATCQDCQVTVTRDELLHRQMREENNGTCVTCGDALDREPGASLIAAWCPTCRAAGRE